jgi:hypothetical protein
VVVERGLRGRAGLPRRAAVGVQYFRLSSYKTRILLIEFPRLILTLIVYRGTSRATALLETITAAFEMEEILSDDSVLHTISIESIIIH